MKKCCCRSGLGVLLGMLVMGVCSEQCSAGEAAEFIHAVYQPDTRFPEFMPLWREGWNWKDENGQQVDYAHEKMPLGGYLYVYVRNTTTEPVRIEDMLLNGASVAKGILREASSRGKYFSSLAYSKLPPTQIEQLVAAGEPVWWKTEPIQISPGGMGEITVRLRREPRTENLRVTVSPEGKPDSTGRLNVRQRQPRFVGIGFSSDLKTVYAYLRHPTGEGKSPNRISVDGEDFTNRSRIAADETVDTSPVVIHLREPLAEGSFHVFRADFDEGTRAMCCVGSWYMDYVYGIWGYSGKGQTAQERRDYYLNDILGHNINALMLAIGGDVKHYLTTDEGAEFAQSAGLHLASRVPGQYRDTLFHVLADEPDSRDFSAKGVDPHKRIGTSGQWLVNLARRYREQNPTTPNLLNIDNTFKPENWHVYGQLPDVACADPYYQEELQSMLHRHPGKMAFHTKPTYVYAVGKTYYSACAPKPMHLILHTCRFGFEPEETPFRGPTPEEKRIEVYYALATGAKQISYWWYTPDRRYEGCGSDRPSMAALWNEIGLLGAEVRTAGPVLVRGCPAQLDTETPPFAWVRSLLAGDDTLVLLVVNHNVFSDRLGTAFKPLENVTVRVHLPNWLEARDVFELDYKGTAGVNWQSCKTSPCLSLDLGTIALTKMVFVTSRLDLRRELQRRYETKCAGNVSKLLAEDR